MSTARGPMPASTLNGAAADTTRKTTPHVPSAAFFSFPLGSSLRSDESRVIANPFSRVGRPTGHARGSLEDSVPYGGADAQSIVRYWSSRDRHRIGAEVAMSSTRTATLQDVADLSGVSRGTASRALTGEGRVSAETRSRVLEAARSLRYSTNSGARNLRRARAGS